MYSAQCKYHRGATTPTVSGYTYLVHLCFYLSWGKPVACQWVNGAEQCPAFSHDIKKGAYRDGEEEEEEKGA